MDKIFKTMSEFLMTRIPEQCRSHHQKMEKKYNNFPNLLKSLRFERFGCHNHEKIVE